MGFRGFPTVQHAEIAQRFARDRNAASVTHVRAAWGDTDAAGFVYYPRLISWMDEACHDFYATLGFSEADLLKPELDQFLAGEIDCRFLSPLTYGDTIAVLCRPIRLEERRVLLKYESGYRSTPHRELTREPLAKKVIIASSQRLPNQLGALYQSSR
jgi:YbgC/YbaW family acyl-CoA thioester hydrolase